MQVSHICRMEKYTMYNLLMILLVTDNLKVNIQVEVKWYMLLADAVLINQKIKRVNKLVFG